MGGGILQLVASRGIENLYLNIDPQITPWKTVYRRHTEFSIFDRKISLKRASYGDSITRNLKNIGDTTLGLSLIVELSDIDLEFDAPTVANIRDILTNYGVTWDTSAYDDIDTVTDAIYTSEIEPLIQTKLDTNVANYEYYNGILSLVDANFAEQPDVFSGDNYLIESRAIDHNSMITGIANANIVLNELSLTNRSDVYVLVDTTVFDIDETTATFTITPNDDLLSDSNGNLMYVSERYLDIQLSYNASALASTNANSKYVMLKQSAITGDYDVSQSVTVSGNIYLTSGTAQKFPGISQNRLVSNIDNSDFTQDGNSAIELFDYGAITDEKNLVYFLVEVGAGAASATTVSVDTTSLDMWRVDPLDTGTNILYFSQAYLAKYNTDYPVNSGTYVGINQLPFIADGASTTIDITMSEYGYQISPGVNRVFDSANLPSSSEAFYVVIHNKSLMKDNTDDTLDLVLTRSGSYPVKFIGQTAVDTLTTSSSIVLADTNVEQTSYTSGENFMIRADASDLSTTSFYSDTDYLLVPKGSATYDSGAETLTFTKEDILRDATDHRYNQYKTPLSQTNAIIDASLDSLDKDGSNLYSLITYYRTEPYVFLMQLYEVLYRPMTSPLNYNTYLVLHRGFLALLKEVLYGVDRNITLCTMVDVINQTYDKYLENILDYDKVYFTYLFTHSDSTDSDGDVVSWTDPFTSESTNKTVQISLARDNIRLMHVIDMGEYAAVPFDSGSIRRYFDHIIAGSYNSTFTTLDTYTIYTNYINSIHGNTLLADRTHNTEFVENQAAKIVESMEYNYFSNIDMLYRAVESIENIKAGTLPIRVSTVYQSTNIYSDISSQRNYGKLDHGNISNQKTNIVDNIINGGLQKNGVEIFYSTKIKTAFREFIGKIHDISSSDEVISYFDKMIYWNDLMTSSAITEVSETSMAATLDIQGGSTATNYTNTFGDKKAILSHLPYALVQNIPYAIDAIILDGGMLDSSSGTYAFPDVINSEKAAFATLIESLFSYVHDGSFSDTITIDDTFASTIYTLNKGTILDDLEDAMFIKVVGSDKTDTSTYYHKDYIANLEYSSDSANSYYVISPFFIDTLSTLPEENGFSEETGLTSVEYVVKYFKRLFKDTLLDLVTVLNNADYAKNISVLTGGDISVGSATINFFDDFYDGLCTVLDGYLQNEIVNENLYSNNLSLYTNRHVFSDLRTGNHNYRLLDIQSAIWNKIQKQNIRAFNELYYDTILSRSVLDSVGGNSLLTLFDRLMVVITGISGAPTYYQEGYTDLLSNTYADNSSESRTNLHPIGFVGLDYYRLRDNTSFTAIKSRLEYEAEYFNYLFTERYTKLKPILNVKYVELSKEDYMFASTQNIIVALTEKLQTDYSLAALDSYSSMIFIIGHVSGGDPADFDGVADEIHNSCVTAYDLIANTAGNHTDTPYAKFELASTDLVTNQFIIGTDPYLYDWFDDNKAVVDMDLPWTLYQTVDNKLTPQLLYSNPLRASVFNNYAKYSDVVLALLGALVETYTSDASRSLYTNLTKNYTTNSEVYSDVVSTCTTQIETSGDIIMQLGVLDDGITDYKVSDSQEIDSVTWNYRYKIIEDGDASVEGSTLQVLINNMINRATPKFKFVKEFGHRLVKQSTIMFDSQIISKLTDEVLSHHARVSVTEDQSRGYNISIGNTTEMQAFTTTQPTVRKLNIPLPHWFNSESHKTINALSTVSLLHTDVMHQISLRDYEDLIIVETGAKYKRRPKIKCRLLGRFAYVGREERKKLAKNRIEYLVPMYQYGGNYVFENANVYQTNKIGMKLNFSDPTKYIWWKIEFHKKTPTTSEAEDDKFNWVVRELKQTSTLYHRTMDECKFKFNGRNREDYKDYTYWNAYHPFTRGINNLNKGEFAWSFAMHPLQYQPSGHASMSSIADVFCIMKLNDAALSALQNGYTMTVKWWSLTNDIVVAMSGLGGRLFFGVKDYH